MDPITKSVIERNAWKSLVAHHQKIRDLHIRKLFADDPARCERMTVEAVGLYLDYSKNRVTEIRVAKVGGFDDRIGEVRFPKTGPPQTRALEVRSD